MHDNSNLIVIQFDNDSETSVSLETVKEMASIFGVYSVEQLIQHALVKLKQDLEVAYPIADGLPAAENSETIAQYISQDIEIEVPSPLFEENTASEEIKPKEYNLIDMISQVTEKNLHGHIDLNSASESSTINKKTPNSNLQEVQNSCDAPSSKDENETFTIQISMMSEEQVLARWRKQMIDISKGKVLTATRHLSFEDWEDLLSIFSDKGKAMVEELRKG